MLADGALEQTDRGGGNREDQLIAEATQQGHGACAGSLRVPERAPFPAGRGACAAGREGAGPLPSGKPEPVIELSNCRRLRREMWQVEQKPRGPLNQRTTWVASPRQWLRSLGLQ